ncbi:MAG: cbb3-type cytochrome c oxidase subunit I [Nitrospinae bacterium]|nr:cbb3-type cytochrome c oxidase subunit I [Nitrospinota bacterium]
MFGVARLYVKTALVFFGAGLFLGGWILAQQVLGFAVASAGTLMSAHTHLTLVGFMTILIMGVAYWMFPRPAREDMRYSPKMAEINYWLITLGTAIRAMGEVGMAFSPNTGLWAPVTVGAAMQIVAGFIFIWNIWSRIRSIGSAQREAKGEKF